MDKSKLKSYLFKKKKKKAKAQSKAKCPLKAIQMVAKEIIPMARDLPKK